MSADMLIVLATIVLAWILCAIDERGDQWTR